MKEEILAQIKESYEQGVKRKKHLSNLLEQITMLEENEIVKKYLKLKQGLETVDYQRLLSETEEQILDDTFYSYRYMIKDTNYA